MDKDQLRNAFALLFLAVSVCTSGCREEGCTDTAAANFDSLAKKDDGSCFYCGDSVTATHRTEHVIENRSYAPYHNQSILQIHLTKSSREILYPQCGDTSFCRMEYRVENKINKDIWYVLEVHLNDTTSLFLDEILPAFESTETIKREIPFSACASLNLDSIYIQRHVIDYNF